MHGTFLFANIVEGEKKRQLRQAASRRDGR
jgi:hypothetical protein